MLFLLRQIRRNLLMKSKITTYLLYGIGEIILVVIGILIAVQIDEWSKEQERKNQELESYGLIIADLRKDSVSFSRAFAGYTEYLDLYFEANRIHSGKAPTRSDLFFDYLVMNINFNSVTQENHRNTIDRMIDQEVRQQLNNYFGGLTAIKITTEEFNQFVQNESRPFFLRKHNVFKNDAVFNEEDRTFPPMLRVSTFDTEKLEVIMKDDEFLPILSGLRMSLGAYLAFLERSIQQNHSLIQTLEQKLN